MIGLASLTLAVYLAVQSATAVLVGLVLNATLGWVVGRPTGSLVLVYYAIVEGRAALAT